jgi:uncharacterized membrane protein
MVPLTLAVGWREALWLAVPVAVLLVLLHPRQRWNAERERAAPSPARASPRRSRSSRERS